MPQWEGVSHAVQVLPGPHQNPDWHAGLQPPPPEDKGAAEEEGAAALLDAAAAEEDGAAADDEEARAEEEGAAVEDDRGPELGAEDGSAAEEAGAEAPDAAEDPPAREVRPPEVPDDAGWEELSAAARLELVSAPDEVLPAVPDELELVCPVPGVPHSAPPQRPPAQSNPEPQSSATSQAFPQTSTGATTSHAPAQASKLADTAAAARGPNGRRRSDIIPPCDGARWVRAGEHDNRTPARTRGPECVWRNRVGGLAAAIRPVVHRTARLGRPRLQVGAWPLPRRRIGRTTANSRNHGTNPEFRQL